MKERLFSAVLTLAVLAGGVGIVSAARSGGETYMITADITQAPNLFEGGRVMVRGVDVGRIVGVEPRTEGVRLTLSINSDVPVPANATLAVIPVTVISDRYVQLFPAYEGGPRMETGDHIPARRTSIPAELDDVLTQLQGLLEALEPANDKQRGTLARLITSLDEVFEGRSDELSGALKGSATVLENLADSDQDLTGIIRNLNDVFLTLANRSSEIAIVNERFQLVAEALLADQDDLQGTIENIAFLSDETASVLAQGGADIGDSFGRLGRVLRTLLKHQGSLKAGIQWSNVIAQTLGGTDRSGKGLYAYSGKQAPVGSDRAGYNYRIDSRDTITCERLNEVARTVLIVTPAATIDEVVGTALSYIPDEYDDHLRFLIKQLMIDCVEWPGGVVPQTRAAAVLEEIADEVGEERFLEFLGRWMVAGMAGTDR